MKAWRVFKRYLFWFLLLPLLGILGGYWFWFSTPPFFEATTNLTLVAQTGGVVDPEGVMKATDTYVKSLINLLGDRGIRQDVLARAGEGSGLGSSRQSAANSLLLKVFGPRAEIAQKTLSILVGTLNGEIARQNRIPQAALRFGTLTTPFSTQENRLSLTLVVLMGFLGGLILSFLLVLLGESLSPRWDSFSDAKEYFKRALLIQRKSNLSWLPLIENFKQSLGRGGGNLVVISNKNTANHFLKGLSQRLERIGYQVVMLDVFPGEISSDRPLIGLFSFGLKEIPESFPQETKALLIVLEKSFATRHLPLLQQLARLSLPLEIIWYEG